MRIQTFVIGYVVALALFLFAQHRPEASETTQPGGFREVVDLTHSLQPPTLDGKSFARLSTAGMVEKASSSVPFQASEQFATRIDAPARVVRGHVDRGPDSGWTADRAAGGARCQRQRQKRSRLSDFRGGHRALGENQRADSAGRGSDGAHGMGISLELHQKLPQPRRQGCYALSRIFRGCSPIPGGGTECSGTRHRYRQPRSWLRQ